MLSSRLWWFIVPLADVADNAFDLRARPSASGKVTRYGWKAALGRTETDGLSVSHRPRAVAWFRRQQPLKW
jgi:hypothetical protein